MTLSQFLEATADTPEDWLALWRLAHLESARSTADCICGC